MPAESSFWQMLTDAGREHDRQLSALLELVRDLRLELDRNTIDVETAALHAENMELKKQLLMLDNEERRRLTAPSVNGTLTREETTGPVESAASTTQKSTGDNTGEAMTESQLTTVEFQPPPVVHEPVVPAPDSPKQAKPALLMSATGSFKFPEQTEGVAGWLDQHFRFVTSPRFEMFVGILVLINTLVMMVEAQYLGLKAGHIAGFPGRDVPLEQAWPGAEHAFLIIDRVFTLIFFVELVVRILRFRIRFFTLPLNWIDVLAVTASIFQVLVEDAFMDATIVRLLRVVRPVRSVKVLQNSKVQRQLTIITKCLQASVVILFWSLCLLLMIQCMIGMVVGQIAQDFVIDLNNPEEGRHKVYLYYGTFTRCLVSMFEIHMANWAVPCRVVLDHIGETWGILLVGYRCVMGYALMSVLGAVFVQQAMSVQQQDHELMILRKQKETERYTKKLKALFETMDTDGDKQLSRLEFDAVTQNEELKHWMESLDINPDDLQGLFDLLDTGDGFVSSDEFLMGATRVRGNARNIDIAQLMVTVGRLESMMEKKMSYMATLIERFDGLEEQMFPREESKVSAWRVFGTTG